MEAVLWLHGQFLAGTEILCATALTGLAASYPLRIVSRRPMEMKLLSEGASRRSPTRCFDEFQQAF